MLGIIRSLKNMKEKKDKRKIIIKEGNYEK